MRIFRTLRPGGKGTMALCDQFGAQLVCVRYRYDETSKRRYTTVEIVVAEGDWEPARSAAGAKSPAWVRVRWGEKDLAIRVKQAGGRWDGERKLWELTLDKVKELGLEDRLVQTSEGV